MAKKATLTTVSSGYNSATVINNNLEAINDKLDNTLSLDGSSPNAMQADIDMDSNDILNVGTLQADEITLGGADLSALTDGASAAAASAAAAAASEAAAAASEAAVLAVEENLPDWQGAWVTSTAYEVGDLVREDGSSYICLVAHTSGTFSTDLGNLYWELFAQKGAAGAGTGDMLAANNLSDVANAATALANIGGQPLDAGLTDIAGLTPNNNSFIVGDGANWTEEPSATARATLQAMYRQASVLSSTDLETISDTGLYRIGTANTNGWTGMAQGDEFLSIVWDVNSAIQIGFRKSTTDPIAYYKVKAAGTWHSWEAQASQNYVDAAIAGISAPVLLASKTASASSSLDFTELDNGTYSRYLFVFKNVKPTTDTADLYVRTSTDGGSTYDAGVSDYTWGVQGTTGSTTTQDASAGSNAGRLTTGAVGLGNAAAEYGLSGEIKLIGAPNTSVYTEYYGYVTYWGQTGFHTRVHVGGARLSAADVDAVRFIMSTGTIASGTIELYGLV